MSNSRRVVIAFLGNFNYDSRCLNLHHSFTERGFKVKVISFDWLTPNFMRQKGEVAVHKLDKKYSLIYYLRFAAILSYNLIQTKADYYFAEDVYTLPFVVSISKINGGRVFYDSRELYGHLAGLKHKQTIQKILYQIERIFIRHVDNVITTGEMDSEFLQKEYGLKETIVLRNLPMRQSGVEPFNFRKKFKLDEEIKILLYQGVILHGRGLKILFEVVKKTSDTFLIVIGDGEHRNYYEELSESEGIKPRVFFMGKVPQRFLLNYTAGADIGFALIENISLSYFYALPNKLFEYIQAGLPVIVSNFPQMKKIVDDYKIGIAVDLEREEDVIAAVVKLIKEKSFYNELKSNCIIAADKLNWNVEIEKMFKIIT